MIEIVALLLGVVTGLRSMMALAAICLAAQIRGIHFGDAYVRFLDYRVSAWIFCAFALAELVADKLPRTPSRKTPGPFATRVVAGALAGSAAGATANLLWLGLILGAVGAVIGTVGGAALRARMAQTFNNDLPAALIEDGAAIVGAILLVRALP